MVDIALCLKKLNLGKGRLNGRGTEGKFVVVAVVVGDHGTTRCLP